MWRRTFITRLALTPSAAALLGGLPRSAQAERESQRAVKASFLALFEAVESLDAPGFRSTLAPAMLAQAPLREAVSQLMASEQQIRFHFRDLTFAGSGTTSIVKAHWERRFVQHSQGQAQAQLRSGTASFTFELIEGQWRLAALAGDNPFVHGPRR